MYRRRCDEAILSATVRPAPLCKRTRNSGNLSASPSWSIDEEHLAHTWHIDCYPPDHSPVMRSQAEPCGTRRDRAGPGGTRRDQREPDGGSCASGQYCGLGRVARLWCRINHDWHPVAGRVLVRQCRTSMALAVSIMVRWLCPVLVHPNDFSQLRRGWALGMPLPGRAGTSVPTSGLGTCPHATWYLPARDLVPARKSLGILARTRLGYLPAHGLGTCPHAASSTCPHAAWVPARTRLRVRART